MATDQSNTAEPRGIREWRAFAKEHGLADLAITFVKQPLHKSLLIKYQRADDVPTSLEQLAEWCAPFGACAAEFAGWGAVMGWVLRRPEASPDPDEAQRLSSQIHRYVADLIRAACYPVISADGENHHTRSDNKRALTAYREWQEAGQPRLAEAIAYEHGRFRGAVARARRAAGIKDTK